MIARTILVIVALAVAVAAALVFLPIAALADPLMRGAAASFSAFGIFAFFAAVFSGVDPQVMGGAFLLALWSIAVAICVAPVLVVALIGEIAGVASALWYVAATGLLAAGLPWIMHTRHLRDVGAAAATSPVEGRLALLFFLTGGLSGFIYWLIAGRRAARTGRPHSRG